MLHTFVEFLFILNRYVHIVCTTLIVGGTFFHELVIPVAIGELKQEQQLAVFGRARWSFRSIMIVCAVLMVISGIVSSARLWNQYTRQEDAAVQISSGGDHPTLARDIHRPSWWWAAHVSTGLIALLIVVSLMSVRRPPDYPLYWMRLSLTVLLVVIFFATVARHMRTVTLELLDSPPARAVQGPE